MTAGRLRHRVGVLVIVGALHGLRGADGNERMRFKGGSALELRFGLQAFVTIPFEVSGAESSSMDDPEWLPSAVRLTPVQLEDPKRSPFLPIRYQIARMLHACTEDCGEQTNQRARDLPDLLLIERLVSPSPTLTCPLSGQHVSRSSPASQAPLAAGDHCLAVACQVERTQR